MYKGTPIRLSADFLAETLQSRRERHDIFKVMKGKNQQSRIFWEQTESNSTLKGSYTMIKWGLSQECKDSSIYANQSM